MLIINVPELRFSEFASLRQSSAQVLGWEEIKLGDLTSKIGSGSTPRGGDKVYTSEGVLFIRSQNVNDDKLDLSDTKFIPEEVHTQMSGSEVKKEDVLLNITGASIGRSCVVPANFITGNVNQHVCIIRTKEDLHNTFLQPFLSSYRGQKLIYQSQTGSGREGLNFKSIASFKLNIPPLPEQQKIATFLSAVDKKLGHLRRKHALLETYKRGIMQKIFPSTSSEQTRPEFRFKQDNGADFPDWEEKRLKELTLINQGLQIPIADRFTEKVDNSYFYITNEFLKDNSDKVFYIKNPSESVVCDENDILMTRTGNTGQVVTNVKGAFHNNFFKIKYSKKVDKDFLVYFLRSTITQNTIMKLAGSSTIPDLNHGDFYRIKINTPSLSEQQKIANFLSSLDNKLQAVQNQIDQTETFKKGLLQKMFV